MVLPLPVAPARRIGIRNRKAVANAVSEHCTLAVVTMPVGGQSRHERQRCVRQQLKTTV
jgi:hypothetical protein